jgi:hypothetical protein
MQLGEIFVKVALAGNKDVVAGLKNISKGFKDLMSSSLEAKVMLGAVLYGFEKLFSSSARTGAELYAFSKAFGLSTEALQNWQFALSKYGVEANEVQGAISGIVKAQSDFIYGQGDVRAFSILGITDVTHKNANQLFNEVINGLKKVSTVEAIQVAKSLGFSDRMLAGIRSVNYERDKPPKNLLLTDEQKKQLQDVNASIILFKLRFTKMWDVFVAEQGKQVVSIIEGVAKGIIKTVEWTQKLSDKFIALKGIIPALGLLIVSAFSPLTALVLATTALLAFSASMEEKEKEVDSVVGMKGKMDELHENRRKKYGEFLGDVFNKISPAIRMAFNAESEPEQISNAMAKGAMKDADLTNIRKAMDSTGIFTKGGSTSNTTINNHQTLSLNGQQGGKLDADTSIKDAWKILMPVQSSPPATFTP